MVEIQRPAGITVGVNNPYEIIYLKGDANTDGSLRITVDPNDNSEFQLEFRDVGVWNLTGLTIAQASILLGRALKVSGAGEFIQTDGFSTGTQALIPHIEYTGAGTIAPHTPILGPLILQDANNQDPDTEQLIGAFFFPLTPPTRRLATGFWVYIGSIPPNGPMSFAVTDGFAGPSLYEVLLPASFFVANSKVRIPFEGGGFVNEPNSTQIYELRTLPPDDSWALGKSSITDTFWFAFDYYELTTTDLVTEDFILGVDGSICLGNSGNFGQGNYTEEVL